MKKSLRGCVVEKCIRISSFFTAFEERLQEDYYFGGETHDFWEFVCVAEGAIGVTAGEDVFLLEKGQAILHRPMEFHRLWSEKKTCPTIIIISFAGDIMPVLKERRLHLTDGEMEALCRMMEGLKDIFRIEEGLAVKSVRSGKEVEAHLFTSQLENMLLAACSRGDASFSLLVSAGAENYRNIVRVLQEHLGERLTLPEAAILCSMSESSMKKTFSRYAGIGMMTYFNEMKIRHAAKLLKEGKSVAQAAEAVGFTDPNYFSTVFKRVTGAAPRAYFIASHTGSEPDGCT